MIPEEMYQTLDETSLEHWVMELPEDEAGCEYPTCEGSATWALVNMPCGHGWQVCDHHLAVERRFRSSHFLHSCNACDALVSGYTTHQI